MSAAREYAFTRRDFDFLRRLSNQRTGIVVTDDKFDMFYSRLARRVRALGLPDFSAYCDYLEQPAHDGEINELVNALTTNLTSFFRENHHFDYLTSDVLPHYAQRNRATRRLRIWSAGCSTGEEPYSLAMVIDEHAAMLQGWEVVLLASDIDSNVLAQAQRGVYPMNRIEGLPRARLKRHFLRGRGGQLGKARVRDHLRSAVRFERINLMGELAVESQDIIFCRNVIIYFDKDTKKALLDKFADVLVDGGFLFVGHSESLHQVSDRFELLGNTVYRKVR
ncbi:MAG: protein-glutamate O-methyltransferase [Gammaproteobacteria bacterium]|nr:protein-glutamate O-methyltransferase [Gammaproteobacteria bacterium]